MVSSRRLLRQISAQWVPPSIRILMWGSPGRVIVVVDNVVVVFIIIIIDRSTVAALLL